MSSATDLCITYFVGNYQKPKQLNFAYYSASLSFSSSFNFTFFRRTPWAIRFLQKSMLPPPSVSTGVTGTVEMDSRGIVCSLVDMVVGRLNFCREGRAIGVKLLTFVVLSACLIVNGVLAGAPNNELEASSTRTVGANDLLIVGPGVLGRIVAEEWRKEHPDSRIFGQTRTRDHHDELIKLGINPCPKGTQTTPKFPYVIFCAPPSGNPDYPGEIREATLSWDGEGCFLFTSSSAPYDCNDNGYCDEDTPDVPIGRSTRTDNLLKSEKVVLEAGGCVVRLAGLYKVDRGAHTYWLEKGSVDVRPDHILNLIHYEDAASLSIAILKKKLRGRIFLGCDNHPLSRQEVMELVNKSGKYSKKFERFTGTSDPLGKKLNNSRTRAELGWEPKYPSFAQFLETL